MNRSLALFSPVSRLLFKPLIAAHPHRPPPPAGREGAGPIPIEGWAKGGTRSRGAEGGELTGEGGLNDDTGGPNDDTPGIGGARFRSVLCWLLRAGDTRKRDSKSPGD